MTPKKKEMTDRSGKAVLPIKYTPDFMAKDGSWIIETKGYLPSHHDFPMRWNFFLGFSRIVSYLYRSCSSAGIGST